MYERRSYRIIIVYYFVSMDVEESRKFFIETRDVGDETKERKRMLNEVVIEEQLGFS